MQVGVVEQRAGIGHGALRRFELGADQFAFSVSRIARALDVDPRWLLSEDPIDPDARVPWCAELPRTGSYADAAAEIGGRLRAARQHRGLTGLQVSERAGYGDRGNVCSQYETGRHAPNLGTCRRLARALDADLCWLITGEGPAPWD